MPYYVSFDEGPETQPLGAFRPSSGESMRNAVGGTFEENVSTLLFRSGQLAVANRGARLSKSDAQAQAKGAGIKLDVPDDGYTQDALDILIRRQQDHAARQSVDERTPWGLGSAVRGGAQLLTGLVDPLNLASAFIPVVGELRAASILARAGEGLVARAGSRATIGAAEGVVGAAALEPFVYAAHSYLGDDYTMADSLVNLAFGGALGSAVHAGAGVIPDIRTRALRREIESLRREGEAAGNALTAAPESVRAEINRMVEHGDLARVAPAPFARVGETDIQTATREAAQDLESKWRAELLAEASRRAEPRAIAGAKSELNDLDQRRETLSSDAEFKRRAKDQQSRGLSRKQSEAVARRSIAAEVADVDATASRLQARVDDNARASQAEQDIAALDSGEIPGRYVQQTQDRAQATVLAGELQRSLMARGDTPAEFIIGMASPRRREVAMRAAMADALNGRSPDVEALIRRGDPREVRAVAQRQAGADQLAVGSPEASRAADARLKDAPGDNSVEAATAELTDAMQQLRDVQRSLEAAGLAPERAEAMNGAMKAFDEGIADSKKVGDAITQYALCGLRQ